MTDQTPTPPVGVVALKRAAARQRSLQSVPMPTASQTGPASAGYTVVLADDPQSWGDTAQGTLLSLPPEARLAGFERLTEDGAALVVLCGRKQARAVAREAAVARGTLEARIAVVPLPGGPLAQYAVARIAEAALTERSHPPAVIVGALPELAGAVVDVGLVGSVSSLDVPGVKLGHHLSSYVPGAKLFAVQITPEPFVAKVGSTGLGAAAEQFAAPDYGPAGARLLSVGPRPVPADLLARWGVQPPAGPVPVPLPLGAFWRDDEAGELVVVPADPAGWVKSHIPVTAALPCNWCGEMLAETTRSCVFCGNTPRAPQP